MDLPLIIILLVVLLLLNAYFTLMEVSMVSFNKSEIKDLASDHNAKATKLLNISDNEKRFLTTIQVGLTLIGLFGSAIASSYLADELSAWITLEIALNASLAYVLSLLFIASIVSFFILILGDILPKGIALKYANPLALNLVNHYYFWKVIFTPFVFLVTHTSNLLLKMVKINPNDSEKVSEAEIISMIESGTEHGTIDEDEQEMISSVFEFNDITAQEIMTPRTEVFMVDINEFDEHTIDEMIEENYSRIPIYDESPDDIIGIIYIKDVFREARKVGFEHIDLRKILNKPYFVPARKKINALFKELQAAKSYMGILVDEYGGFIGIVTIEDLIEEIVGDIFDEYDDDSQDIKKVSDNLYIVDGLLSISEVNETLNLDIPEDDQYETLAGFVLHHLGYIPNEKESIEFESDHILFKVIKMDEKRIDQIQLTILKDGSNELNNKENQEQS